MDSLVSHISLLFLFFFSSLGSSFFFVGSPFQFHLNLNTRSMPGSLPLFNSFFKGFVRQRIGLFVGWSGALRLTMPENQQGKGHALMPFKLKVLPVAVASGPHLVVA